MPDERTSQRYLNFDLEVGQGTGREYPLAARSPAGEARAVMRFPFDELALESRLKDLQIALLRSGGRRRQTLTAEEQAVRAFGAALFEALLAGGVRDCYQASLAQSAAQGLGLRLRLRIAAPELAALPWEYLYDARQAEYTCLSAHTPLVRYPEAPQPIRPLAVALPLRVLGVIADPQDQERLEVERERERLERALGDLQRRGAAALTWLENPDWRALLRALHGGPWHIFHFIGHGGFDAQADQGLVVLTGDDGRSQPLSAVELARLLADHRPLRLAVLNACLGAYGGAHDLFSSVAAVLARRGLPAVLAMQYEITDRAAIEFSQAFYKALADGLPVDAAVSEARKALSLAVANSLEWGVPALYMRAENGALFEWAADHGPRTTGQAAAKAAAGDTYNVTIIGSQGIAVGEGAQASAEAPRREAPGLRPAEKPSAPPPADRGTSVASGPSPAVQLAPGVSMTFMRLPAGEFLMGSRDDDPDAYDNEKPQHSVSLDEYWIGQYPVTNAQYRAFVQATKHRPPSHWEEGEIPQGKEQHPVVNVSWENARAFCQWASQVAKREVRLPTEAEWEKAASWEAGGKKRKYPWGGEPPDERRSNFGNKFSDTTPVGKFSPLGDSPCGCADMAGNVWEWVADWYDVYPGGDFGASKHFGQTYRVVRGGSWSGDGYYLRSAGRYWVDPAVTSNYFGFRCARSP
ncbi:MAG: SUMF1/EgtB/PvdO family nonheme iron enzyme [Anaerolineales bacterium]|nr:SUMF1/EgtB/PvdO family nonheme iron enzyme [Anaerolineales bacterium]